MEKGFNLKLAEWLNARDYVSGDWPANVPHAIRLEADRAVGGGHVLDLLGWPQCRACNGVAVLWAGKGTVQCGACGGTGRAKP